MAVGCVANTHAAAKFVLLEEKIYDIAIKTQIEQHVVAEGVPTRAELETEIHESLARGPSVSVSSGTTIA